jgi:hypothetical protein
VAINTVSDMVIQRIGVLVIGVYNGNRHPLRRVLIAKKNTVTVTHGRQNVYLKDSGRIRSLIKDWTFIVSIIHFYPVWQ